MKTNKNGIAVLIVVLVTAILISSITLLWRSASLSYEAAMWYYRSKKQLYAAESLVIYGLVLLKKNLISIQKLSAKNLATIYQGNWPKQNHDWGKLLIGYEQKDKKFTIQAQIFNNELITPIANSIVICQKEQEELKILSWHKI